MRCYICNCNDAENHDPRDDKWFCDTCHTENIRIAWEQDTLFRWEDEEDPWGEDELLIDSELVDLEGGGYGS